LALSSLAFYWTLLKESLGKRVEILFPYFRIPSSLVVRYWKLVAEMLEAKFFFSLMSESEAFLVANLPTRSSLTPFMSALFHVLPSSTPSSISRSAVLLSVHAMCSISTYRHFLFHPPSPSSNFLLSFLIFFF